MSTKKRGVEELVDVDVVLDTSAYSRFRGGDTRVADGMAAASTVSLPMIVLGELEAGFVVGSRPAENHVALADFLREPFVRVLDVTRDIAARYGAIFAALRKKRTPIGTNDIWIAATALVHGGRLLTFDDDYAKVPGLDPVILR